MPDLGSWTARRKKKLPMQTIDLPVHRLGFGAVADRDLQRSVPTEAPVSIEICGIGYAVMMATPSDLDDYAVGFALTEGLVGHAGEIEAIDVDEVEGGWAVRIWLPFDR